jgi:NAD(P)-dependent dehydrogenase (short-subunit alcohol dehydrogenase family)
MKPSKSEEANATGKSVLITGCSSGIGRASALHLSQRGFTVFATVRKEADAENLRGLNLPDLVPLSPLDLSQREQIPAIAGIVAAELNRRGQQGLHALIHNAGGGDIAPIEWMDLDNFQRELLARVAGSVGLTQALLPQIRQGRGRIVWIVTPALMPTPYVASIHACDFAVNCLARTLEIELKPWDIPNVMIRCGGIKTPAGLRTTADIEALLRKQPPVQLGLYEKAMRRWKADMTAFDKQRTAPEQVARLIERTLLAQNPRRRYSIGHMAGAAAFLEDLPSWAVDIILKTRF